MIPHGDFPLNNTVHSTIVWRTSLTLEADFDTGVAPFFQQSQWLQLSHTCPKANCSIFQAFICCLRLAVVGKIADEQEFVPEKGSQTDCKGLWIPLAARDLNRGPPCTILRVGGHVAQIAIRVCCKVSSTHLPEGPGKKRTSPLGP